LAMPFVKWSHLLKSDLLIYKSSHSVSFDFWWVHQWNIER
jgi:hypothetical protein